MIKERTFGNVQIKFSFAIAFQIAKTRYWSYNKKAFFQEESMNSFIKKNWFVSLLIVVFAVISVYYIYDTNKGKLKGKTSGGEDVVYSIGDSDVTASKFYDAMFENGGTAVLYQTFVKAVAEQAVETTDEMKTNAEAQESSVISNYASNYPTNYKEMLNSQLKSLGYKGYDDLAQYLIDHTKQLEIVSDYAESHFDDLKIRNISYLLVKFEDTASPEGEPTEDEQSRMNDVDAAFAEGKTFAEVAANFSEDTSTASSGGVLGTVDVNTTTLDQSFLNGALALKEGEISDWIYSENFGYFRIQCNAATPESLEKVYREQNSLTDEVEVAKSDIYSSLTSSYDTTLENVALWEKGQEIGITFNDPDMEAKLKSYMGVTE